jgi:hypothetical protein
MMLHDLLEQLITTHALKPSRIGPMRTAVKQYAAILGMDPKSCSPSVYHLHHDKNNDQISPLIEANPPADIGPDALRNLKNNIRFLLRQAVELRLIPPLPPPQEPLASFQKRSLIPQRGLRQGEDMPRDRYGLYPLPPALAREYKPSAPGLCSPMPPIVRSGLKSARSP